MPKKQPLNKKMKILFKEIKPIIKLSIDQKQPSLLAYVSLKLIDEHERHFTVNGFTIRKSQYNGNPYLTMPSKKAGVGYYKFAIIDKSLLKEIEKEVLSQFQYESIPVIEEGG